MRNYSEISQFQQVEDYIQNLFVAPDPALEHATQQMALHSLPFINVSANEGKLLYLLAKMCQAKKILELGTLGGYSTIWLARALPSDGKLLSLEYSGKHAKVARQNLAYAGLTDKVEVRQGDAKILLPQIMQNKEGPFDLIFIDADKEGYPIYLQWAVKLSRAGTVILTDNVIRDGAVAHEDAIKYGSSEISAIARFNQDLAAHPQLETIVTPFMRDVVDGLAISIVKG